MLAAAFVSVVVGIVEVAPNRCQVDLLNPNDSIHTFETDCSYVTAEQVIIPYRAPYGP